MAFERELEKQIANKIKALRSSVAREYNPKREEKL